MYTYFYKYKTRVIGVDSEREATELQRPADTFVFNNLGGCGVQL